MTAVLLRNIPAVATTTSPGSTGMAAAWNGYTPVPGDTLVALVAAGSTAGTTIGATNRHSGTTGWRKRLEVFSDTSADSTVVAALWTSRARGGDPAPVFTAAKTGSGGSSAGAVILAALANTSPYSWDCYGMQGSGAVAAAITSQAASTSGPVSASGDYVLAANARQQASGATSYSSTWANLAATSAASILHLGADGLAGPAPGAPASDTGTWTGASSSASGAALAVAFRVYTGAGFAVFF